MKKLLLIPFLLSSVFAQTYEEYLKSQEQAFSSFKEARDKEFSEFLSKEWKAYQEDKGSLGYEKDKPTVLPKAPKKKITKIKKEEIKKKVIVIQKPIVKEKPKVYKQIVIPPVSQRLKTLYIKYFGVELEVHYDKSLLFTLDKELDKKDIASAWDTLASSEYETTIKELETISKKLKLNGWAKYLLVQKVSHALFNNQNEARVFTWFALLKMGYDAHISYQTHKIVLLLPIEGNLYNTIYYTLKGKKYYAIDYYAKGKVGSIMTYDNVYEGATAAIDFYIDELPLLVEDKQNKGLNFRVENKPQSINLEYNANVMKFFQSYPQVSYVNYFSSPESLLLENSIKHSFEPLLKGKSQSEALDLLLNFVQNAFKYQVDDKQFNREKVMFPSETIFYPYSDCEDRAILFTYMVKTLLGMDVVGVKYPNHMATAVKIEEKVQGEYVRLDQKRYIVADPTYINASIGMSMPQFKGSSSYVIVSTGSEK